MNRRSFQRLAKLYRLYLTIPGLFATFVGNLCIILEKAIAFFGQWGIRESNFYSVLDASKNESLSLTVRYRKIAIGFDRSLILPPMFGIFRYVLALLVVISHLSPKPTSNAPGTYAVFGFYILSGYLMTLILNKTYKFSLDGLKRFLINRFLRIYPTYWIVAIASIGIIFLIPNITQSLNKALVLPTSSLNSIYNIVLIGLTQSTASRLVPPAWALSVELSFYILMAIALVRNRLITTIWFIGSLVYTLYMIANNYSIESRYFPLQAASLPFSTGAVIYFFRFQYAPKFATTSLSTINWRFWIVTFLFVANALYGSSVIEPNTVGFYFSYFLGFYLVFYLASVDVKKLPN